MYAEENGHLEITNLLLENGANPGKLLISPPCPIFGQALTIDIYHKYLSFHYS